MGVLYLYFTRWKLVWKYVFITFTYHLYLENEKCTFDFDLKNKKQNKNKNKHTHPPPHTHTPTPHTHTHTQTKQNKTKQKNKTKQNKKQNKTNQCWKTQLPRVLPLKSVEDNQTIIFGLMALFFWKFIWRDLFKNSFFFLSLFKFFLVEYLNLHWPCCQT